MRAGSLGLLELGSLEVSSALQRAPPPYGTQIMLLRLWLTNLVFTPPQPLPRPQFHGDADRCACMRQLLSGACLRAASTHFLSGDVRLLGDLRQVPPASPPAVVAAYAAAALFSVLAVQSFLISKKLPSWWVFMCAVRL